MKHIFIRHSRLDDMQGICYGALDVAVADHIIKQHAKELKNVLPPALPIISSPLQRCLALAQAIDSNTKQDPRLLEMNFGDWQGKAWDHINRVQLEQWANNVTKFHPSNGENFIDVITRLSEFLHDLNEPHILITHAGVIRAAHFLLGGVDVMDAASVEVPYVTPVYFPLP
jgi:alpha-ribazole phosphatase